MLHNLIFDTSMKFFVFVKGVKFPIQPYLIHND